MQRSLIISQKPKPMQRGANLAQKLVRPVAPLLLSCEWLQPLFRLFFREMKRLFKKLSAEKMDCSGALAHIHTHTHITTYAHTRNDTHTLMHTCTSACTHTNTYARVHILSCSSLKWTEVAGQGTKYSSTESVPLSWEAAGTAAGANLTNSCFYGCLVKRLWWTSSCPYLQSCNQFCLSGKGMGEGLLRGLGGEQ